MTASTLLLKSSVEISTSGIFVSDLFSLCCKKCLYKGTALSRTIAVFLCINLYIFIPRSFDATVINSFLLFISQKLFLLNLREIQYSDPSSSALTIVSELYFFVGLDKSHCINKSLVFILFIVPCPQFVFIYYYFSTFTKAHGHF